MIDRLSIEKSMKDSIITRIDERKFLGLDNDTVEHIEMFMFAAAVGIHIGVRTPLSSKLGFIQATAVRPEQMSAIFSVMVDEMRKTNTEDKINDRDTAFNIIQEYANTGLAEIGKWMNETKDNDKLWNLITEMDDMYEEYFGSENCTPNP